MSLSTFCYCKELRGVSVLRGGVASGKKDVKFLCEQVPRHVILSIHLLNSTPYIRSLYTIASLKRLLFQVTKDAMMGLMKEHLGRYCRIFGYSFLLNCKDY